MPPPLVVGLLAPLTGLSFQADSAVTARRLPQVGRDLLDGSTHATGGIPEAPPPISLATLRQLPPPCSGVDQRLVRERSLDQRSPAACARSLVLVTVADAQGLRLYAERARCQRLAMPPAG